MAATSEAVPILHNAFTEECMPYEQFLSILIPDPKNETIS